MIIFYTAELILVLEEKIMTNYLTKSELASLLKVSQNTINAWVCKGKIPYLKLGKGKKSMVRFKREEIENWLKKNQ